MFQENYDFHNFKVLTIHSTIAYITAYLLVFLLYHVTTGFIGFFYNIDTHLLYYKLHFITIDASPLWNFDSVFYVFGSGTYILAILIFILIFVYHKKKTKEKWNKILMFWIIMHCINRIIGLFIIGTLIGDKMYYYNVVLDWLYVGYYIRIFMVVIAFFSLFALGNLSKKPLLFSTYSFKLTTVKKRDFFMKHQAIYPWFISSIIIFIIQLPGVSFVENTLSMSMFLIIFPTNFKKQKIMLPLPEDKDPDPKFPIPWKKIIVAGSFLLLFRIVLEWGISF